MNKSVALPKRFWVYLVLIGVLACFLFLNMLRTDGWTGDRVFSEFTAWHWLLFALFIAEEAALVIPIFILVKQISKIARKRNDELTAQWKKERILSTVAGSYDYVWIDFALERRALIRKFDKWYYVSVQKKDPHTGNWEYEKGESGHESLAAVGKTLYNDYHFYCEENMHNEGA